MIEALLAAARRFAETHTDASGIARTSIAGLSIVRATSPSGLDHAISCPLVALVLQGSKSVTTGAQHFSFSAGESLLITADVPTVSQITRASAATPYFSLVFHIERPVIAELMAEMKVVTATDGAPVQIEPTDAEVIDAALRLMRLIERPASIPVLGAQLKREMHYWLLAGRHGPAIRRLGLVDSHAQRVGRAVALIRAEFKRPLPVELLADAAGMSSSSFHQHFRAMTSLSPLQFQKQLRLIEARRLMLAEGLSASSAAFEVGYESVSQFTREYGRLLGLPPAKDVETVRRAQSAA
jgi:AraC-like DNA-binding protein